MGRFEFAVAMSLHFLIFAALRGTPFAALPYASKVTGLLEHLQIETSPMANIGVGQLIARIDRSWDRREDIRARIRGRFPELKSHARRTNQLPLEVLRDKRAQPPETEAELAAETHHRRHQVGGAIAKTR